MTSEKIESMRIVLFMTYGSSLKSWKEEKILERELALYDKFRESGIGVSIFSYGGKGEKEIVSNQTGPAVLHNKWHLPYCLYSCLAPLLHHSSLGQADIYKTNQMSGAHVARWCSKFFRKPIIVRQGYSLYEFTRDDLSMRWRFKYLVRWYERRNLQGADATIFTTKEMAQRAIQRYQLNSSKVHIIPNYVVSSVWTPPYQVKMNNRRPIVGFVGRFTPQKNLENLVHALRGQEVELHLVGSGKLEQQIRTLSAEWGVGCQVLGRMPQREIVEIMRLWHCFVLPSNYEGHPKALIEAMTFGMPILVADSPGIHGVIENKVEGIVVRPTVHGLRTGICEMLKMSSERRIQIGTSARKKANNLYGLDTIVENELTLFKQLLDPTP